MDFLCDIDGTIAEIEHRRHWVRCKPRNWPAFEKNMHLDTLIEPVAAVIRALHSHGNRIIMCSARGEQSRKVTEEWLQNNNICYEDLYMRPLKDSRDDQLVKKEMLDRIRNDGYNPVAVIDDRPKVVRMWRKQGLFVFDVGNGIEF
jgi:hypothetical protein